MSKYSKAFFKWGLLIINVLFASGFGSTLIESSVSTVSVPKDPDNNLHKSYPVTFFTTVPPDLIVSPFPLIPWKPNKWSRALPDLNLLGPEKLQAITPPIEPSLLWPVKRNPKSLGSKASCWLFLSSFEIISLIGVPDLTLIYSSSGLYSMIPE